MEDLHLRAYLLGRMTVADAERIEERLLEDDEVFEALRGAEDDLYDAYARGDLEAGDEERFRERYLAESDRIAFARVLAARGAAASRPDRQRVVQFPLRRRTPWIPFAAAAMLLLAAGAGWWMREPSVPAAPALARGTTPGFSAPPVVVALALGTSRAAGEPSAIALPASASEMQLRVRLNPADRFDRYAMELRSSADRVVWRGDDLHAAPDGADLVVSAIVPGGTLTSGVCELAVRGGGQDLGVLTVRFIRTP